MLDASALVEALVGTDLGTAVRARMRGRILHAPAHLDAEVLSALGRLHRSGELADHLVAAMLDELASAPVHRHPLTPLLGGAWERRSQLRLVDANGRRRVGRLELLAGDKADLFAHGPVLLTHLRRLFLAQRSK